MSPSVLSSESVEILDIRQNDMAFSLADTIYKSLNPPEGQARSFPTLLLYDTEGLRLFEKITYLEEYYLTNTEIEILTTHARRIVERIPDGARIVELGSGNLRKVNILLRECERVEKHVDYYALDLDLAELQRTFSEISPEGFTNVRLHGLHGTYDDGLLWLQKPENRERPTVVLSLGSSIGNFDRPAAAKFLANFSNALKPSDYLLIGLDACQDAERVFQAYNDSEGVTRQFYENGLKHANQVLGYEAFKADQWDIVTAWNPDLGCHQAAYSPRCDVTINGTVIRKGEKLGFEDAFKYSREQRDELCRKAGLIPQFEYGNSSDNYHVHLFSPATLDLPTRSTEYAASSVPSVKDLQSLWTVWDIVTKTMIPQEELLSQPIKLRNTLIFYLGHIPTFSGIYTYDQILAGKPTDPKYYQQIFERGIDPDVDDPEQCHSHSEIPDEWPPLMEILEYQERVRDRARSLVQKYHKSKDRTLGEGIWIGFEHEAMHLETFLYMLLQSDKHRSRGKRIEKPNQWFRIPKQTVKIGLDDSNDHADPKESFGWDNEKPQRKVTVHSFEAQGRPVTNGEYAKYLEANRLQSMPASWILLNGEQEYPPAQDINRSSPGASDRYLSSFAVRTVFGAVPLALAQDWPLMASFDELANYAKWMECRIPTFEEVQSIYAYADQLKGSNGLLDNHRDVAGCNIGFQNWHPVPVTPHGDKLAGQGEMGGVWEVDQYSVGSS
ncbi:hypothetical protein N7470_008578 [Penicillium chermesinum]|nr:hypothetical protein N7470_008578 [Penicillium chermesinum]